MNILGPSAILLTSVTFQVEYQPASPNEIIWISGNVPQLGQFDVSKAIELSLSKTPSSSSSWSVTVSLPSELPVEYKYIMKVNNKIKKWEGFSGTRKLKPTGFNVLVDDGQFGTDSTPELLSPLSTSSSNLTEDYETEVWEKGADGQSQLVKRRTARRVLVDCGWLVNEVQLRVYLHKRTSFILPNFSLENSSETSSLNGTSSPIDKVKGSQLRTTVSIENLSSSLTFTDDSINTNNDTNNNNGTTTNNNNSDCYNEDNIFSANNNDFSYACVEFFPHVIATNSKIASGDYRAILTLLDPMALQYDESTVMDECFVINAPDQSKLSFHIDFISKSQSSEYPNGELLGRVSIHSHELADMRGYLKRTIIGKNLDALGVLSFQYLITTPFSHPNNNLAASMWYRNWGKELLYIGHRGSGATDNANEAQNVPTENTLLSFLAAARLGADYIEFDVQLTKDKVPIIAHDEEIVVVTTSRDGEEISLKVPLNKLSLAKLRQLKPVMDKPSPFLGNSSNDNGDNHNNNKNNNTADVTHDIISKNNTTTHANNTTTTTTTNNTLLPIPTTPTMLNELQNTVLPPFHRLVRSKSEDLLSNHMVKINLTQPDTPSSSSDPTSSSSTSSNFQRIRSSSLLRMANDADSFWNSLDTYPTLEQAFRHLPPSVGFNVEIKYPDAESQATYLSVLERNQYVDHILQVLFDCAQAQARSQPHAPPRHVLISSFDPEICQLCAAKQPCYPVFFLTTGGTDGPVIPSLPGGLIDPRRFSLAAALAFARQARLAGLVTHADSVLQAKPSARAFVSRVHRLGLLLFTYGRTNGELEPVKAQQEAGVDAVICDRVFRVKRASRDGAAPKSNSRNPYLGNFWVHPPSGAPNITA